MEENGREESLLVRAEPLEWAQEISWTAHSISTPTPSWPVDQHGAGKQGRKGQ